MGRWLGQIRTVPSHRAIMGSQHKSGSITGTTVSDRIGVGVGLQIGMPRKHWNRVGSQHPVIVEGMGRGVGFDVNEALKLNRCVGFEVNDALGLITGFGVIDALGLHRGASEGQSKIVGSQQSISCMVGMGVIEADALQIGANEGQVINRGSQHASGGIEGNPVPPPGGHCGTKSGQGNFAGSQHAPAGKEGKPVLEALIEGQIGWEASVHCMREGSQQASGGRAVVEADRQTS